MVFVAEGWRDISFCKKINPREAGLIRNYKNRVS